MTDLVAVSHGAATHTTHGHAGLLIADIHAIAGSDRGLQLTFDDGTKVLLAGTASLNGYLV